MTTVELEQDEEKPLDPEMEKVRRKMVRLLVVSIGIMILGVMAVLAGVVYKVMTPETEPETVAAQPFAVPAEAPLQITASLPAGFSVDTVALDGARMLLYGRKADGSAGALIIDIATGRTVADISLK